MPALNIKQLSKRYHLPPTQRKQQAMLDASLNEAIEIHLETALTEAGIDADEEVCVRLVHVPLNFSFSQSQSKTSRHWSRTIAHQIRRELDQGGANVIRYRSRLHALIAFADDISRNSLQRCWAWNQLGLASLPQNADLAQARSQLLTALLHEPVAILAVITRLAESNRLIPWLDDLSAQDRIMLLDGICFTASIERRWLNTESSSSRSNQIPQTSALNNNALLRSRILSHLRKNAGNTASQLLSTRIWGLLVLLELEPMLFRRPDSMVAQAITHVEAKLIQVLAGASESSQDNPDRVSTSINSQTVSSTQLDGGREGHNDHPSDRSVQAPSEAPNGTGLGIEQTQDGIKSIMDDAKVGEQSDQTDDTGLEPAFAEQLVDFQVVPAQANKFHFEDGVLNSALDQRGELPPLPLGTPIGKVPAPRGGVLENKFETLRSVITSEFAGLFLLLPVLAETGADIKTSLIEQIAAELAFEARPLSWVLYQLTTRWLSIPTRDPALRAFCGIDIDSDWPWPVDDAATPTEADALAKYATVIGTRVRLKFRYSDPEQSRIIEKLCCRYAKLFVDNGWLELTFNLDQVDTEIRRAGLDLDPGFVPWLGKVVKIRYE